MADPTAIVEAYRLLTGKTRDRILAAAQAAWYGMDSWSDEAADQLVGQIVPVVLAAEHNTAAATIAYLQALTGVTAKVDLEQVTGPAIRNGADPAEVYRRPVIEARAVYSRQQIVDLAVETGLRRLLGTAATDLQLTRTHTANQVMLQTGIRTYRMVTRPGACPLCVAASDQIYTTGTLQPIHSNCHCVTLPGDRVPTGLKGRGLQTTTGHDPEQDTGGRRLVLDFNDEIGPVLDWDTQTAKLRRSKDVPAASPEAARAMKRAQLDGYRRVLATGGGTDWMRAKADQLHAELSA